MSEGGEDLLETACVCGQRLLYWQLSGVRVCPCFLSSGLFTLAGRLVLPGLITVASWTTTLVLFLAVYLHFLQCCSFSQTPCHSHTETPYFSSSAFISMDQNAVHSGRSPAWPRKHQDRSNEARQTSRFLDSVPVRHVQRAAPGEVSYPVLGPPNADDDLLSQSDGDSTAHPSGPLLPASSSQESSSGINQESCSPTSSEIDALEESFYDLEIQSTPTEEVLDSKPASQNTASSADYIEDAVSPTPVSHLSRWSSEDLELHMSGSIGDRLRLVWRKSAVTHWHPLRN